MIYVIASHVLFHNRYDEVYGPSHHLSDFLEKNHKEVVFIKHSIYSGYPSSVYRHSKTKKIGKFYRANLLFKSVEEIILTMSEVYRIKPAPYYIGVDPVNALSGVILKRLSKIQRFIYFSPDYADKRFKNSILNWIYLFIDRLALKYADEIWSISSRLYKKRLSQGVLEHKLKILPNSPAIDSVPKNRYDGNLNLIIVSHLTKSLDIETLLETLFNLVHMNNKFKLHIIGKGPQERAIRELVKKKRLQKHVKLYGQLSHLEVLKKLANSFIGLALYTDENSWNYYGDSMKAREYVACGIPVIINMIPSTADDVNKYHAGLVLKKINVEEMFDFIKKCSVNKKYYYQLRKNALEMGRKFDKEILLKKLFTL